MLWYYRKAAGKESRGVEKVLELVSGYMMCRFQGCPEQVTDALAGIRAEAERI